MNFVKLLKMKNSLKIHSFFHTLKQRIIDILHEQVPDIQKLKMNNELTLFVCNLVENLSPKKSKIDKLNLVVEILDIFFHYTDDDKKVISGQIQFAYDHKMIKKIPMIKKAFQVVKNLFMK